ncbi:MAG: flagellar hook-length control protein FliK [Massilia sp.]|nr:flagellar hook-length control protein FliK [Massilia sp.]
MLTTVTPSTPARQAQQAKAPAAAQDTQAAAASTAAPAAPTQAQSFARWLGQHPDGAAQALAAQPAVPGTDDGATPATAGAPAAGTPDRTDGKSADDTGAAATGAPDGTLLAAMAMPLMPLSPQQVTQALQAAQGGARAGSDERSGAPAADASAQPLAVSGQDGRRAALPQAGFAQTAQAQQATQPDATAANMRLAVQGNATGGSNAGTDAQDANPDHAPVQAGTNAAAMSLPGVVGTQPAQPAADTVKLAGPPTAWRQSLQETLGDRLNVHVANNVQQATISIEPPQLGRIDIAIRHSAGTLEVNISATNGDVLRQLQTVSDNLRNDLAQRQYTEVAVTVTPLPKNHAAPFGDPQQQGRGRQQGRDQDNEPGRGLAEAGNPASVFNLGRDS